MRWSLIVLVYARKTIIQTSIGFFMQLIKVEIHEKFASLKRFLDIANEIRQLDRKSPRRHITKIAR